MNAMRITLRARPEAVAALDAKAAAQDAERAERERAYAARPLTPAKPVLAAVTAKPEKPKKVWRPRAPKPWTPDLTWAGGLPVVLPCAHDQLGEREAAIANTTLSAVARIAVTRPGDAGRMASKLEAYLGVTMEDRAKVWAPVREMLAELGSPNVAADLAELAGVKVKRQRVSGPRPKKAPKKKQAVKHSDGATPERAKKSRLIEEPIYAVDPTAPRETRKGAQDALPPPKMILVGRAMRDKSADAKTRLERYRGLETQHISAGVRLAADWERAGLEPHMTANLLATGGGSSAEAWGEGLGDKAMRARDNLHRAIKALHAGGLDVVHVVEAIVLSGESATVAASGTYSDKPRASAHVAATLKVGLNLLDRHYNPGRYKADHAGDCEEQT